MDSNHAEIRKYIRALKKRKYLFIILALLIMSIAVWGSYFLPKQYEAKSTIFIESNVIRNLVSGIAITPSMQDRIRVLSYAILSRGLILKALRDLDLDSKVEGNNAALDSMITDFQKRTKIAVKGGDLFIVSVMDSDAQIAMNYVNSLVRRYIEENLSAKREEAYGANRFLNEQIALFKEKVDKADKEVINFRRQKGIYTSVDEGSLIGEINKYKEELERLKIRRNELLATKDKLEKQLAGEEPFSVAIVRHVEGGKGDAPITVLENKIKNLLVRYNENYPEIVKLRAQIEALKKQRAAEPDLPRNSNGDVEPEMSAANPIFQDLRQKLLQTETEIDGVAAKYSEISAIIGQKSGELRYLPEGKKELSDLIRERDNYREMYQQLMQRAGQSEVSKQMEIEDKAATFRIVDPAVLPTKPISPNRVVIILFGIVAGIIGGFGGVVLREALDFSIRDVQGLKGMVKGVEILAIIPRMVTEREREIERKKTKLAYSIAGSYFLVICMILLHELMGFTFIDNLISRFMT